MTPRDYSLPTPTVDQLLTLRQDPDALRLITDLLKVKDMGPADHIRTKHEVKTFVESGDTAIAQTLIKENSARRSVTETATERLSQQRGQRTA